MENKSTKPPEVLGSEIKAMANAALKSWQSGILVGPPWDWSELAAKVDELVQLARVNSNSQACAQIPEARYAYPWVSQAAMCPGMTMREYFAAHASDLDVEAAMRDIDLRALSPEITKTEKVVLARYLFADVMLRLGISEVE